MAVLLALLGAGLGYVAAASASGKVHEALMIASEGVRPAPTAPLTVAGTAETHHSTPPTDSGSREHALGTGNRQW